MNKDKWAYEQQEMLLPTLNSRKEIEIITYKRQLPADLTWSHLKYIQICSFRWRHS